MSRLNSSPHAIQRTHKEEGQIHPSTPIPQGMINKNCRVWAGGGSIAETVREEKKCTVTEMHPSPIPFLLQENNTQNLVILLSSFDIK